MRDDWRGCHFSGSNIMLYKRRLAGACLPSSTTTLDLCLRLARPQVWPSLPSLLFGFWVSLSSLSVQHGVLVLIGLSLVYCRRFLSVVSRLPVGVSPHRVWSAPLQRSSTLHPWPRQCWACVLSYTCPTWSGHPQLPGDSLHTFPSPHEAGLEPEMIHSAM